MTEIIKMSEFSNFHIPS